MSDTWVVDDGVDQLLERTSAGQAYYLPPNAATADPTITATLPAAPRHSADNTADNPAGEGRRRPQP